MTTKTKPTKAKDVKVGDRINTSNGMREVLKVTNHGGFIALTVQCPASPPKWESILDCLPDSLHAVARKS